MNEHGSADESGVRPRPPTRFRREHRQPAQGSTGAAITTTGPIPRQPASTTGQVPATPSAAATGPMPMQRVTTTGPMPMQRVTTTGPVPAQPYASPSSPPSGPSPSLQGHGPSDRTSADRAPLPGRVPASKREAVDPDAFASITAPAPNGTITTAPRPPSTGPVGRAAPASADEWKASVDAASATQALPRLDLQDLAPRNDDFGGGPVGSMGTDEFGPEAFAADPYDPVDRSTPTGISLDREPAFGELEFPVEYDDYPDPLFSKRSVRVAMGAALLAAGGLAVAALPSLLSGDDDEAASFQIEDESTNPPETQSAITRAVPQLEGLITPRPGSDPGVLTPTTEVGATSTTDTTVDPSVWVEPEVEPESQWVDGGNGVLLPDLLLRIRFCESTNNYVAANRSSSARGAYQFLSKSWDWYGHAEVTGVAEAHLATPAQQDEAAVRTYKSEGARPWAESRRCWDDPNLTPEYATAKPPKPAPTTTEAPAPTTDSTSPPPSDSSSTTAAATTTETTSDPEPTTTETPTTSTSTSSSEPAPTTTMGDSTSTST